MINICVPSLKRYDLLALLIDSIRESKKLPDAIWVIDNGGGFFEGDKKDFTDEWGIEHHYIKFGHNLGCAASWNWFIQNVSEDRIIMNDDCRVFPETIGKLVEANDPNCIVYPAGMPSTNSFSCFLIPNSVVERIGLFDENISPQWAYYEDVDYWRRLTLAAMELRGVPDCRIDHFGSATVKQLTATEEAEHHRRFQIATQNYVSKWGGMPHHETYRHPYGNRRRS